MQISKGCGSIKMVILILLSDRIDLEKIHGLHALDQLLIKKRLLMPIHTHTQILFWIKN